MWPDTGTDGCAFLGLLLPSSLLELEDVPRVIVGGDIGDNGEMGSSLSLSSLRVIGSMFGCVCGRVLTDRGGRGPPPAAPKKRPKADNTQTNKQTNKIKLRKRRTNENATMTMKGNYEDNKNASKNMYGCVYMLTDGTACTGKEISAKECVI